MRHLTLLVFTFGDMFPQPFHPGAVRCDRTFPVFVRAFRCMSFVAADVALAVFDPRGMGVESGLVR